MAHNGPRALRAAICVSLVILLSLPTAWAASVSNTLAVAVTSSSSQATILPSPPSGHTWVQTFGDEFNSAFNTSVWDVDHYGGSPNATTTTNNGILTITIDTNSPDTRTIIDTWTTSGGSGNQAFAQRYGYFVYRIKLPTCSSGEYDVEFFGRDNWTGGGLPVGKYAEMAIASGKNECNYRNLRPYQADGNAGFSFMSDPDIGVDVTLDFHQYGLLWVDDGSAHGSVTMYCDGTPFSGPVQLSSAGWDVGLFFDLYWSPEQAGNTLGGSNGVPDNGSVMQVDWIRAYQLTGGTGSISPDGTIISGGTGSLMTAAGTWTFGALVSPGQWNILLNGVCVGGCGIGSEMEVAHGGTLYLLGNDGNWYTYNPSTQTYTRGSAP